MWSDGYEVEDVNGGIIWKEWLKIGWQKKPTKKSKTLDLWVAPKNEPNLEHQSHERRSWKKGTTPNTRRRRRNNKEMSNSLVLNVTELIKISYCQNIMSTEDTKYSEQRILTCCGSWNIGSVYGSANL